MRRTFLPALVVTLALAAGCGGEDEPAGEAWAGDVCSAAADWRAALEEAAEELSNPEELSVESVRAAVDDGLEATETFVERLRAAGPPETEGGAEADAVVESLSDQLEAEVEELRTALAGETGSLPELLQQASEVAALAAEMAQEVQSSLQQLEELQPGQELADAIEANEDCDEARAGGGG